MQYIGLLVLLEAILFILNFKAGSYLVGWDNIMPEFNIPLNFERAIFAVWQEYRGLGVIDGLAHAANFMHTLYIWIFSIFLPQEILRFFYIHLTHLLGGIFFFLLIDKLIKNKKISFLGGLFYMLNIGVLQMYFAPLEAFATHFVALPLLSLLTINALQKRSPKNLLLLFLGALLASPQSFVPTLFAAFFMFFIFILVIDFMKNRDLKKTIIVLFILLSANAFWLVSYPYSAIKQGSTIKNARINQFSSEEIFLRNKSYGNLVDTLFLRGFMLDSVELDPNTFTDTFFMNSLRNHEKGPLYRIIFSAALIVSLLGLFYALKQKLWGYFPFLLSYLTAFFFLANNTFPVSLANNFLREAFPLFGEALRFPFTKFILLFSFSLSVFFTLGLYFLYQKIKLQKFFISIVFVLTIFLAYPAFLGQFTSPFLRNKIPNDYLALFKDLQKVDKSARIALVPSYTFWSWQYRVWGQRGSDFIWYGIPQPITHRAFDPWSNYNEQFYNEYSYALNTQNVRLLSNIIEKYDLSYLLLDQYFLNTVSRKTINYDSLKRFLNASNLFESKKTFGRLMLYKTRGNKAPAYLLPESSTKKVSSNYSFEKEDLAFNIFPNYVTNSSASSLTTVFPSLFTEKTPEDVEFSLKERLTDFIFEKSDSFPNNPEDYTLEVPSILKTEFLIPVKVIVGDGELIIKPVFPRIVLNNEELNLSEKDIKVNFSINNPTEVEFLDINNKIDIRKNSYSYLINSLVNSIKIKNSKGEEQVIYIDTSKIVPETFHIGLSGVKIDSLKIIVRKIDSSLSTSKVIEDSNFDTKTGLNNLSRFSKPYAFSKADISYNKVILSARDSSAELTLFLPNLFHQGSYVVFSNTKYLSGLPLRFYIDNPIEQRAEVETVFSKEVKNYPIIVGQTERFFKGYGFHFISKSVGNEISKTEISDISVYPFPSLFIKNLRFVKTADLNSQNKNPKQFVDVHRVNPSLYVANSVKNGSYLVFSQSYDPGWKAYAIGECQMSNVKCQISKAFPFLFGKEIKNHFLVNNWENGWLVDKSSIINGQSSIVILYLPQYLEYLGFILTIVTLIFLTFRYYFVRMPSLS